MKFSALALLGVAATGVVAGGKSSNTKDCSKIIWEPAACKPYSPRDLNEVDERDVDELDERSYGGGDSSSVCHMKCPDKKVHCSKEGWAAGYPKLKASFSTSVDCKKGKDYTVSGKIAPCKRGGGECIIVNYKCQTWPKDHKISYAGVYQTKPTGVKKFKDLNSRAYCQGDVCEIPVKTISKYEKYCDKDLWVGFDAGRCEPNHSSYGYGEKKPSSDVIGWAKLHLECHGKKECESYCCKA